MQISKQLLISDAFRFTILLFISAISLYFLPKAFSAFIFFIFLVFSFFSNRDYFWITFFYTISLDIGGFFYKITDKIFSFGPFEISPLYMYAIVMILKTFYRPVRVNNNLKFFWILIALYTVFLVFWGIFGYGFEGGGRSGYRYYYQIARFLPLVFLIPILPRYFKSFDTMVLIANLFFIAVFINFAGQILELFLGKAVNTFFVAEDFLIDNRIRERSFTEEFIRPAWGVWHTFLAIAFVLIFNLKKSSFFKNAYLQAIFFLSFSSIIFTGSRGWISAMLMLVILSIMIVPSLIKKLRMFNSLLLFVLLFLIFYFGSSGFKRQIDYSFERFATIVLIFEGDLTAGNTLARATTRHDNIISLFYESPVFGLGLSENALSNNDTHVGMQKILMVGGIFGMLLFLVFWIATFYKLHSKSNEFKKHPGYDQELIIISILFLCIIFIHATSTSIFDFIIGLVHPYKMIFIAFLFSIINYFLVYHSQYVAQNNK
jgi:hypothetical protein